MLYISSEPTESNLGILTGLEPPRLNLMQKLIQLLFIAQEKI